MRGSTRLRRSLRRCLGRGNGALSGRASWARARGLPDLCSPMAQRQKDSLALPSAEHQAVESGQAGVETWKYKAKNSLMYYPEGERRAGPAGWTGLQGVFLSGPSGVQILRAAGGGGVGGGGVCRRSQHRRARPGCARWGPAHLPRACPPDAMGFAPSTRRPRRRAAVQEATAGGA